MYAYLCMCLINLKIGMIKSFNWILFNRIIEIFGSAELLIKRYIPQIQRIMLMYFGCETRGEQTKGNS